MKIELSPTVHCYYCEYDGALQLDDLINEVQALQETICKTNFFAILTVFNNEYIFNNNDDYYSFLEGLKAAKRILS